MRSPARPRAGSLVPRRLASLARWAIATSGLLAATLAAAQDPVPQPLAEERAALQAVWPGALGLSASADWYRQLKQRHSAQSLLSRPDLQRLLQEWRVKRDEQLADALAQWKRDLRSAPNAVAVDTVLARALPLPGDRESIAGQALGEAAQLRLVELQPGAPATVLAATTTPAAPTASNASAPTTAPGAPDTTPAPAATAGPSLASGSAASPVAASAADPVVPPTVDSVVAALSMPPRGIRVTPRQPGSAPATRPAPPPVAARLTAPVVAQASPAPQALSASASSSTDEPNEAELREAVQAHLQGLSAEIERRRLTCWQGRSRSDPGAWLLCEGTTDATGTSGGALRLVRFTKRSCRVAPSTGSLLCSYALQLAGPVPPPAAPLLSVLTGRGGEAEAPFDRQDGRWTAQIASP